MIGLRIYIVIVLLLASLLVNSVMASPTTTAICGPGVHWVDTCPSGIDVPVSHSIQMQLDLTGIGQFDIKLEGGDFRVYRAEAEDGPVTITPPISDNLPSEYLPETYGSADSHHDVIRTELISMIFEGETPLGQHVTIRAGDNNGNLENDGPFYSPGILYESPENPAEAYSIFFVTFVMEIEGFTEKFYGQSKVMYRFNEQQGLGGVGFYEKLGYDEFGNPIFGSKIYTFVNGVWKVAGLLINVVHKIILPIELSEMTVSSSGDNVLVEWETGVELKNVGFRLRRAVENQNGGYDSVVLGESDSRQIALGSSGSCSNEIQGQLKIIDLNQNSNTISAIGNSRESTCYSFIDTNSLSDETYYYLLEDIGDNGDSTFHCDQIDAVTIGQGPAVELESAINYCKEVTGNED